MRLALLAILIVSASAMAVPPQSALIPRLDPDGFPLPREAVRRLGSAKFLCGYCTQLAYSTDGKTVFVCGYGVAAWDVATGKRQWTELDGVSVHAIALTEDNKAVWVAGSKLVKGSYVGTLYRFDANTGRRLFERKLDDEHLSHDVHLSRGGRVFFHATNNPKLYDPDRQEPLPLPQPPGVTTRIWGVDLFEDGERLLMQEAPTEGYPRRVWSMSIKTGKVIHEWHSETYGGFRYGPTPDTVVRTTGGAYTVPDTGRQNKPTFLMHWDLKANKELRSIALAPAGVRAGQPSAYSPDGTRAVITINGSPVLFDTTTWKPIREYPALRHVQAVAFSPDGKTLAVGGQKLAFLDVATGKLLHGSTPFNNWEGEFAFVDGGRTVLREYGVFGQLRYDVDTGKLTVKPDDGPTDLASYRYVVRDREGLRQARNLIVDNDLNDPRQGAIELHTVAQPNVVRELPGKSWDYSDLRFAPTGRHILGERDHGVTVWNLDQADGKPRTIDWRRLDGGSRLNSGPRVELCPNGQHLTAHQANSTGTETDPTQRWVIGLYDLSAEAPICELAGIGNVFTPPVWSADGSRFAFGGCKLSENTTKHFVSVYDLKTKQLVVDERVLPDYVGSVALSADARTLVVSSGSTIQLIEVATGGVRRSITTGDVFKMATHPVGRHFATESVTNGVLLWDALSSPAPWPADADTLWDALGGDSAKAHAAIRTLVANPAKALPLLKTKMAELKPLLADRIAALVTQLGDRDFAAREAASRELLTHLDNARSALKAAVADPNANPEAKARAGKLLAQLAPNTPDRLRVLRAVEAVELTGTPDAILLLRVWSVGASFLASEASAALARLKR